MMTTFKAGWIPDVPDARDRDARLTLLKAVPPPPPSARNDDLVKVVDQARLGACTVHGAGQAVRAAQLLEVVEVARKAWVDGSKDPSTFDAAATLAAAQSRVPFWSRLFMYFLARAFDGDTANDDGTQIRLVFQAANKFGYPAESAWSYDDDSSRGAKFSRMPPAESFREAFDQRLDMANTDANLIDYSRITSTGDARVLDIQAAVAARHLVVFGTNVTEAFCSDGSANGGLPIHVPKSSDPIAGGHAVCVGGYDADGAEIINSWSTSYGGGGPTNLPPGWFKFGWDYMKWSQTSDLWIVRRAPMLPAVAA